MSEQAALQATARFMMDEPYLRMLWDDRVRTVSRFRRFGLPLDLLMIAAGLLFGLIFPIDGLERVFIVVLVLGLFGLTWEIFVKVRWFKKMRAAPQFGKEVELVFSDDDVEMSGPLTHSTCKWAYFARAEKGAEGLFLVPEKGWLMYVPYQAIRPSEAVAAIVAKARA